MSACRKISILGATGSVGRAAIDVIAGARGSEREFSVVSVTANANVELLASQAKQLGAQFAAVADEQLYGDLKTALAGTGIAVGAGATALVEAASAKADCVVSAIVGVAGLESTLAAVQCGANVALANKESMVCAGPLLKDAARRSGATILPIDSEHNAIFQVLDRPERVEKVTLTASGGPFRTRTLEQMKAATPEEALRHPNWSMGSKITIDSATMMNKGLELIEAAYLFDLVADQLEVVIHPSSIVHSLVSYDDGSVLAQLGQPDMRIPISYALAWPTRMRLPDVQRLDLADIGSLEFFPPDTKRFPALALARQCLELGGASPVVLNASNEVAVDAFLQGRIGFLEIADCVEEALEAADSDCAARNGEAMTLADVLAVDRQTRARTGERVSSLASVGN